MARELVVRIVGDERAYTRSLDRASRKSKEFNRDMDRTFRGVVAGSGAFSSLGRSVAFASTAFLGGVGITALMKGSVDAASDFNEEVAKSEQIFQRSSGVVKDFAENASETLKISTTEALGFSSAIGAMLKTAGLAGPRLAAMSTRLVQLGADMASFNNQDPTDMLDRLRSGLAGEAEPLRRFGVLLSEARVKQEAYNTGLAKQGAELTEQQKVLARYSLILKDTADQQGDVARTGDQVAGQQRELRARVKDLQVEIGQKLLPRFGQLLEVMNRTIEVSDRLGDSWGRLKDSKFGDFLKQVRGQTARFDEELGRLVQPGEEGAVAVIKKMASAFDDVGDAIKRASENLTPFRQALADITDAFQAAAGKFGKTQAAGAGGSANLAPFRLPFAIQLAQAKAAATQAKKDDLEVARDVRDFARQVIASVEPLVLSGKFSGARLKKLRDKLAAAYAALADANATLAASAQDSADKAKRDADEQKAKERAAREKRRRALEELRSKLQAAIQDTRDQVGRLFEGPILAPTAAQQRQALGFPSADIGRLTADVRAQTTLFKQFQQGLARLTRLGAPSQLISQLRERGTESLTLIRSILSGTKGEREALFRAIRAQDIAVQQAAAVSINARVVRIAGAKVERDERQMVVVMDGETVGRIVTVRQQKKAGRQAAQVRGRHAGANVALQ